MSTEQNKQLVRRFFDDVLNAGKLELVDEFAAENYLEHEEFPGLAGGREGVKRFVAMFREAFPDFRVDVHDIVAEGDMVAIRSSFGGTHRGEFLGIAPTGKKIDVPVFDLVRIENGQAAEHWGVTDSMTLMQQLGAIPTE